ncbi:lysophospholipid acyltransferase family protein [Massilia cavernae]|uniref:1-acyl-sn-glycerol-3-phosphate acyltransferase n=1 Tax=Massilia cavernae TaxID=2320864 RepID=A0A418XEH2_9BURK|nr:lysophospholipid acyltransferase family protein [Massilia cavernae]RJG10807.1 1-acyl-sn-glycerol-3-phosphate acyltransferase [Massilia cavernae]
MKPIFAFRLFRILVHLFEGLATCALLFPWVGTGRRNARILNWSRRLLAICNVTVEAPGGVPALQHALIVANHVSWLDIFVINAVHPCRFVAKSEIRAWPVLGWLVAQAGTVFIARGSRRDLRHVFKGLVAALEMGQRVAFFPEGTTAPQGTVLPFHANLFEAAVDSKVMVQPYALKYVDARGALHEAVDYTGGTTFVQSVVKILSSPPIRAQLTCLQPIDGAGAHRRAVAEQAHDAIAGALKAA